MSENQKHTENQLYKTCTGVYAGTRQLAIKEQRGRKYVNFQGKQVNLKDIPEGFAPEQDEVFRYIFCYGFRDSPDSKLDTLAKERIYKKPPPQLKTTRTVVVGLKTGEKQTFEVEKTEDIREWLQTHNICYKYFRY